MSSNREAELKVVSSLEFGYPEKTLSQYLVNVGTPSATLAQHRVSFSCRLSIERLHVFIPEPDSLMTISLLANYKLIDQLILDMGACVAS